MAGVVDVHVVVLIGVGVVVIFPSVLLVVDVIVVVMIPCSWYYDYKW